MRKIVLGLFFLVCVVSTYSFTKISSYSKPSISKVRVDELLEIPLVGESARESIESKQAYIPNEEDLRELMDNKDLHLEDYSKSLGRRVCLYIWTTKDDYANVCRGTKDSGIKSGNQFAGRYLVFYDCDSDRIYAVIMIP